MLYFTVKEFIYSYHFNILWQTVRGQDTRQAACSIVLFLFIIHLHSHQQRVNIVEHPP